jgi:hypothetical protein
MRPQSVQQWLSTLTACSPSELKFVINGILWELSERGMSIVDYNKVRMVFSPVIDASKRRLQEELAHHRDLIAERYGESAVAAFADPGALDAPFIAESYFARRTDELMDVLAEKRAAVERLRAEATLTQSDRADLARFRARERFRHRETAHRKRSVQNRRLRIKPKRKKKR